MMDKNYSFLTSRQNARSCAEAVKHDKLEKGLSEDVLGVGDKVKISAVSNSRWLVLDGL
jgi:hypothetical protein